MVHTYTVIVTIISCLTWKTCHWMKKDKSQIVCIHPALWLLIWVEPLLLHQKKNVNIWPKTFISSTQNELASPPYISYRWRIKRGRWKTSKLDIGWFITNGTTMVVVVRRLYKKCIKTYSVLERVSPSHICEVRDRMLVG